MYREGEQIRIRNEILLLFRKVKYNFLFAIQSVSPAADTFLSYIITNGVSDDKKVDTDRSSDTTLMEIERNTYNTTIQSNGSQKYLFPFWLPMSLNFTAYE